MKITMNDSLAHTQSPNERLDLVLDSAEVEAASGMGGGPDVIRIRVDNEQGLGAYFWISVAINKQNRPVVTVSTELGDNTTRKSVTGTCSKL